VYLKRGTRWPYGRAHDQGNKVEGRLCQPDLDLETLEMAMGCPEAQEHGPICEALTNMFDVAICQRIHHRTPWILPNWSYWSHICRFAMVPFILQLVPQALQALVLPFFQEVTEMLATNIP
jgi:hypothetical protein